MRSRDARRGRTCVPPERPPHMSSNLNWLDEEPRQTDQDAAAAARARQAQLTKPPGALGDLETLAITLAGWQGRAPCLERVHISVFAADHGVTAEGVPAVSAGRPRAEDWETSPRPAAGKARGPPPAKIAGPQ